MVNVYQFKGRGLEPGGSQVLLPIIKHKAMVVRDLHVCRSQNVGGGGFFHVNYSLSLGGNLLTLL
jgi:hypothetical protein